MQHFRRLDIILRRCIGCALMRNLFTLFLLVSGISSAQLPHTTAIMASFVPPPSPPEWFTESPIQHRGPYASALLAADAGCTAAGRTHPVVNTSRSVTEPDYGCDDGPGTFPCVNPPFDCFGQVKIIYYYTTDGVGACDTSNRTICTSVDAVCAASEAASPGSCSSATGPYSSAPGTPCTFTGDPTWCEDPSNKTIIPTY